MIAPPLRVLIVDDNPEDRMLIIRELRQEYPDASIVEVVDQQQLDEALKDCQFHVVITDYQLRWTTGLAVLEAVKAVAPRCPVIMFTATGNEEVAVEAMKNGLDDYIIKNVRHLVRLRGAVRSVVEHARTSHAAEQLQMRLASLLSRLRVGVFSCSADGRLSEANAAFLRIFRFPSKEACLGQPIRDRFSDPAQYDQYLEAVRAGKQAEHVELGARTVDGETIWVHLSLSLQGPAAPAAIEGLVDDITTRKRTEQQLRQREAELAHLDRLNTLAEMVAGIAHEVNQPLYAVANYANGMLARMRAGTENREYLREGLELVTEQVQRAADILRKYRQFAGKHSPERTTFPIDDVLRESIELLAPQIRQQQLAIEYDLAHPPPRVNADRTQICQVLVNLVRNALEAMSDTPPGERRIRVTTRVAGSNLQASVSDRGHGLPASGYQPLLEPFVTTKPDGMGMGLAVCARIVRAHRGEIWATPNPDRGATFHFTLPLAQEQPG